MPGVVNDMYEFGEFRMDVQNRILRRYQNLVPLTPKAFEVLQVLVQKNGEVIAKDEQGRRQGFEQEIGQKEAAAD